MTSTGLYQLEKLRPLGRLEQWSTARHHLGYYNNVGVSVCYKAQRCADVKTLVFNALSVVIPQHPILSAIPVDEDTQSPYFARLPEVNLDCAVTFINRKIEFKHLAYDKELDELLEIQHNKDFKHDYGSLPFWRLIIFSNPILGPEIEFVASFIYHHALGDGMSGIAFHDSFFSALIEAQDDPMPEAIVRTSEYSIPAELERLHSMQLPPPPPTPPSPVPSTSRDRSGLWTGNAVQAPLLSRFQSLAFSKDLTTALAVACREQGTTLTAAIQVVVALALFQSIPEEKVELDCSVPVSLRRWLPGVGGTSMGNYLDGLMETYHRCDLHEFSWAEARRSRQTVQKYLASNGEFLNVARIKLISNIVDMFSSQLGKDRNSSFDVSNLGLLGDPMKGRQQTWKRGRAVFSRSASVTQAALSVGVVTGGDGCLVLGIVWQERVVEQVRVEAVTKRVEIEMRNLSRV